jgi:hypothetical protein
MWVCWYYFCLFVCCVAAAGPAHWYARLGVFVDFSSGSTSEWLHRVHVVCVDTTDDCFVSHGCPVGFTDLVLVSVIVYGSMEQVGC